MNDVIKHTLFAKGLSSYHEPCICLGMFWERVKLALEVELEVVEVVGLGYEWGGGYHPKCILCMKAQHY